MKRAYWATLLALGALASSARADREPLGTYRFRSFGSSEGLHNLVVSTISEDARGYLWVGTDDGVYRWDGERFDHLTVEQGLPSTNVYVIAPDPTGHVCAGTDQGIACWDGAHFSAAAGAGLPAAPVLALVPDHDQLWAGASDGLYVRGASGRFARAPGWTRTTPIKAMCADSRGLVVTDGNRVFVGTGDGVWRELADIGLTGDPIDDVFRARDGALWIRSALHAWRLAPGAARATDVTAGLPPRYGGVGIPVSMVDGPDGEVWLGTDTGIARRVGDQWLMLDRSTGLPSSDARTLFVDRQGTTWVGSIGLFELRGRGLIERHDRGTGLPGDVAWSFGRDREGTLFVGTSQCLAHAVDGRWLCVPGTENRVVRSFVFPPQGGVFLGGAPSDLVYIDPRGIATSLPVNPARPDDYLLALRLGTDGDLWIATTRGLYRLRGGGVPGHVERVAVPGVRADAPFRSLLVADGRLWSATPDGIVVLDHGEWRVFDARAGFRATSMRYLVKSHGRRMCVAYTEAIGVTCFDSDGSTVSNLDHIGTAQGLGSGMVYFLGEDRNQRLWVGTGDGVDVVTPRGIEHFAETDGLASDDAAATAFFEDADGSLWLGSSGGVSHLHAERYTGPLPAPNVVIREGTLGDRALGAVIPEGLETTHDHDALAIAFGIDALADSTRIEYQVRLTPHESVWSTTRLPQARYAALSPDHYALEIRARFGRGAWGRPTTLAFVVRPAWWQTGWFLAAASIAGLLAVGLAFAWRQRILLSRRTKQLNAESVANVHALLEVVPDLIAVYRDGKLTYLNRAARRLWGAVEDGAALDERLHPDDRAKRIEMVESAQSSETPLPPLELRTRDHLDRWRTCEVSCARLELAGARVVVVSGRDVTERNQLRSQVLVSDRMASLGTLAAGVGHEINNPLAYVIGNLELITELAGSRGDAELATAVRDAADGAQRVRKIVQGLRAFSRSEEEQRVSLDVAEVLRAATRLAANEVRHRAQLVWELGAAPRVIADDGRLTQVFINLIVNAAHAIPDGHSDANRITLRTATDAIGRAVIEIVDTGCGMPPEVAARAFDPFFSTKDVGGGTGLGLAICHGIVVALGGEIVLESVTGRGTTARVLLPAAAATAATIVAEPPPPPALPVAAAQASPPPSPGRHRVMIVDDDPLVAEMIARALRREHEVVVAPCGDEALGHVKAGARFDVVISDVMMPNMTGIELLEALVEIAPDQACKLIFLSGGAFAPETRARLDELGTKQFEKPISLKDLRAAVASVINAAA